MTDKKKLTKREKIIIGCSVGGVLVVSGIFLVYVKKTNKLLKINAETIDDLKKTVYSLKKSSDRIGIAGTDTLDRIGIASTGDISLGDVLAENVLINSSVQVIERIGRGHPGYIVEHLESGITYKSQWEAANALGLNPSDVSKHLNGLKKHVRGNTFRRITMPEYDLAS